MDRLALLRKTFKKLQKRSEELRAIEPDKMTDEESQELRDLISKLTRAKQDIDDELEARELEKAANGDGDGGEGRGAGATVKDAPIYRGSAVSAMGQQAIDVAIVTAPGNARSDVAAARDRLEKNTKRSLELIEKRQGQPASEEFREKSFRPIFNPEARDAGTGQTQSIGSEGGFLLQSETSIDLMTHGFNNNAVLSRCSRRTLTGSESLKVIGLDETSRADGSRGGGVRVYTDAELSQITSSRTKFDKIKLAPERLTGLYYASDKILQNATFLGQEMKQLFSEEFAFKTQDLVMEGTGAGQALGIKSADCTVEVSAQDGQAATTIQTENILKMFARFYLRGSDQSVCWTANRDCFEQLMTLSYTFGTAGELARLFIPARRPGDKASMLGYPVEFIEQAESLGTAGDIQLNDFSQYLCVDYGDINEASSIHFKFDYGQTTFRFVYYFDGQPRLVSEITPFKGSGNTVSPFVRVADRS